jgi:hypothetical protein
MTSPTIPTLIPITEAARKYGLSEQRIKSLIAHGKINAAMIGDTMVVTETDVQQEVAPLRKEDLPEYKKMPI